MELLIKQRNDKTLLLENDKKIISSIQNETYKNLSQQIELVSKDIERIKNSRKTYGDFLDNLVELLMQHRLNDADDEYAKRVLEIISKFEQIDELTEIENGYSYKLKTYPNTEAILIEKDTELTTLKQKVVDYFTSIGSTEDCIADVDRATSSVAVLSNAIEEIERRIYLKNEHFDALNRRISGISETAKECAWVITNRLKKINEDLIIENDNVERIKFDYRFDTIRFRNALDNDFYNQFRDYHRHNLSWENIYWCLDLIPPNEQLLDLTHEAFLTELALKTFDRNTLYAKVFTEIFEKESNFKIYQLLVKKHLFDISHNIEIIGFYGNVPLTSCSFGQRCTAVIITLLMTGMKPLIIDEPEAHLDNRLIAEYLVELVKQKKNERQIIFATHNANFVVNGDAELIHILDIPRGKIYTEITSTTIENLKHRKRLLKLEGGEEAFKNRDKKLLSNVN